MKKGFTLIELMVVIVIIGILAAIAVPKMFGMSAKAKAAEVGPAAGSWSKIQGAYITETTNAADFITIGYLPPGADAATSTSNTANFEYKDVLGTAVTSHGYWTAINLTKLNACVLVAPGTAATAANSWNADYYALSSKPTAAASTATGCKELTPNFAALQ